jgi:hypothetical protein
VRDTTGAPRLGAIVTVDAAPGRLARTGPDGAFRLDSLPLGTTTAVVRAIGFPPQSLPVAVRPGVPAPLEVTLRGVVTLAGVTVRATRTAASSYMLDAVNRRRRLSLGGFIDSTTIHRYQQLRTAFAQAPTGIVRALPGGAWGLATMAGCPFLVAVDGRLSQWDLVMDLPPDYVVAIETYRPRTHPSEYEYLYEQAKAGATGGCGLVLVWTRSAR